MATWSIDAAHSSVQFKVKHLMISTVTGTFGNFEGQVVPTNDANFAGADVSFSLAVGSIATGQDQRDLHLKSPEFFDAEAFPNITFQSTAFEANADQSYTLKGNLTIKNQTKPVVLKAEYGGIMTDFYGNTKAGFDVKGKINRQDFGLTWSAVTEAGGVVVSDDVNLLMEIQLVKN
jgi:polyisoprenoid-binding protein YceI